MRKRPRNRNPEATPAKAREAIGSLQRQLQSVSGLWARLADDATRDRSSVGALSEIDAQMRALFDPLQEIERLLATAERDALRRREEDRAIAGLIATAKTFYSLRWEADDADANTIVAATDECRRKLRLPPIPAPDIIRAIRTSRDPTKRLTHQTLAALYVRRILPDFRGIERMIRRLRQETRPINR